jgi:hypothetical protein
MKRMMFFAAAVLLMAFKPGTDDEIDGVWMGYYRSDLLKEKLIVKFSQEDKMEFYTGGVDERTRTEGSYRILGDSVTIYYLTPDGTEMTLKGHFNHRKNFVDGIWSVNNKTGGRFYLEKQKLEEYYAKL